MASDLVVAVAKVLLAAVPLALSTWALLDAARRPEWVFAFARRSRTAWVAMNGLGVLFCGPGVLVALYYLLRVRPRLAAIERGRLDP